VRFIALKDFWSDELNSQYAAGMVYTARPANDQVISSSHPDHVKARANRGKLAELLPVWRKEGKVAYATVDLPEAEVGGVGAVV
jgi:hypothetical protein